jgi:hypothetical protein
MFNKIGYIDLLRKKIRNYKLLDKSVQVRVLQLRLKYVVSTL